MTRVLYDYQIFSMQKFGGISRYFANLHSSFLKSADVYSVLGVKYSNNHYISQFNEPVNSFTGKFLSENKINKWNKGYTRKLLRTNDYDLFHPTYYDPYFLAAIKKPFVITVHDMIHEKFPDYFLPDNEYAYYKRQVIEKAQHIIAISESTKRDLQQYLNVSEGRITTVYHGYRKIISEQLKTAKVPVKPYILFVGDRKVYKNFGRFVYALEHVFKKYKDIQLVCAGSKEFGLAEWELFKRTGLQNRVNHINASDNELHDLYKGALLFVFPSLYEGFGFPILEAFDAGCPVAASNTSSFKEVGGNGIAYFNPMDIQEIVNVITVVLENSEFATRLKAEGRMQLQKFLMEDCVAKTAAVYQRVAGR